MDFSPHADSFVNHYASVRGQVRLRLLDEQVAAAIPPGSRVLDVGGGAGHLGSLLAERGHRVVVIDPSERMRLAGADAVARSGGRLTIEAGSDADVPGRSDAGTFDAVLCHAVAPYVDDLDQLVSNVVSAVAPGGVVSFVVKNRDALAMRPALERRWEDVVDAVDADGDAGGLGVLNRAHTLDEIAGRLAEHDCSVVEWFGIRVFSDHLAPDDGAPIDLVVEAERAVTDRDPYRGIGRLLHLIAHRSGLGTR